MIEEIFKKCNLKITKQRKLIYEIIENSSEEANIKYIISKCNNDVDIATIYRTIEIFLQKQIITKHLNHEGTIFYLVNNHKHEHYLNCIKCHKKEKILFCPIDEIQEHIVKENNFYIIDHNIEFNGLCKRCKNKNIEAKDNNL